MDKKPLPPKFVKADDYTKYYANSAKIVRTPWDISMVFGQSETHSIIPESKKEFTISDGVEIVMSYQHAVSLFNLLKGHIEKIVVDGNKSDRTAH